MELYLHIPFCVRKCAYCDFLSAPADAYTVEQYLNMLERQLVCEAASFHGTVSSIFIGGGTPTILQPDQIKKLMDTLQSSFSVEKDAEITIEANPGTISQKKAEAIVSCGINRVSLGLQSASDEELRLLGRIHTYRDFLRSYERLRQCGIENINVDLMSALPGQTVESYQNTLQQVALLKPAHISAYSLIIEEGTEFYERYAQDEKLREQGEMPKFLPSEEAERVMYDLTGAYLARHGYERYEISNYALPGKECRHNKGYWTGEPYLGIGLGASSYVDGVRYKNTDDLSSYLQGDFSRYEEQKLSKTEKMEEFFYLGLRLTEGVSSADFYHRFGFLPEQVYGQVLKELSEQGLLLRTKQGYRLSAYGNDVSNQVLYRFLL